MIIARPTVSEERWLVLALRYPALRQKVEEAGSGGPWKTTTWLARCLGFVLGVVGTGMFAGMLVSFPSPWLLGGLVMVIVAEWLVAQRRVIHSGVEEIVYLCGAISIVVQILLWNRSGGHEEVGVALIAAAALLVGWRLLNPYITTLAAALLSLAVAMSSGHLFGGGMREMEAGAFCAALSVGALMSSGWQWQRPSTDRMLDGLVVVMPWLAYGWLAAWSGSDASVRGQVALAFVLAFLVLYVVVGVKRRSHAPLIGALGLVVCMAWALQHPRFDFTRIVYAAERRGRVEQHNGYRLVLHAGFHHHRAAGFADVAGFLQFDIPAAFAHQGIGIFIALLAAGA